MLAVVLAILVKLAIILKLGLRNISKRITSLIFLNIYTPPQHVLTYLSFKLIDKGDSKFDLKIKETSHISWIKPNLNAQQNYTSLLLHLIITLLVNSFHNYVINICPRQLLWFT